MNEYEFITYDEVLKRTEEGLRYLLLGNGFSIAYDKEKFSFKSLFDYAIKNSIQENAPLRDILKYFHIYHNTCDFEKIIKKLEEASVINYFYYKDQDKVVFEIHNNPCEYRIQEDIDLLKNSLIEILTSLHPEHAHKLHDDDYNTSINFIKEYNAIFTLNYDLLLNWIILELQYGKEYQDIHKRLNVNDGFRYENGELIFMGMGNRSIQTIYYLHGALHIIDEDINITKIVSNPNKYLLQKIKENINNSRYPIFVSEGTWHKKLSKIRKNFYLNHCYETLNNLKINEQENNDSLIIFGTILKSNDEHILNAIKNNNIKNIYIGVSSENKIREECSHIFRELEKTKKLYFYDYKSVDVWNSKL